MSGKERFELLLEDLHTNFKVVVERVIALDEKFDTKIDELKMELKQDIAVVDAKVMGLAKRLDTVEERLSREITEVRSDLADHRNNTEMHKIPRKRALKKAV